MLVMCFVGGMSCEDAEMLVLSMDEYRDTEADGKELEICAAVVLHEHHPD